MNQSESSRYCKFKLVIFLVVNGAITSSVNFALAQITPDTTLGSESSLVTEINPQLRQIGGGAPRGANLFHSFQEFNVVEGQAVNFTNPAGIENILSRVTGGSRSEILGKLSVSGGNANLFLINPNGIIFGPNASLDVKGSFVATTANAIQFGNQGFFSASAPNTPGLLTVNPSALLSNQIAAESISITNNSRSQLGLDPSDRLGRRRLFGLQVPDGRSLLLVGGNVILNGGGLNALGGRVELGGLAGVGTVGLDIQGNNLRLSFPDGAARADVSLTNGAIVVASGEGGGNIQVHGRRVLLNNGSRISAITLGSKPGGSLILTASESVKLIGPGELLTTRTRGAGDAGDITITTGKLIIQNGAQVLTSSNGEGSGGQLTVNASESVKLTGISPGGVPNVLISSAVASGDGGDINITTRRLLIQDGGIISADSSSSVSDPSLPVIPATGQAGNLTVNASDSIELSGTTPNGTPSILSTETRGSRDSGNLKITTGQLIIRDRALVSVSSEGTGDTGNLEVTARSIRLENEGKLTATSELGTGGGNIKLQNLDSLLLRGNSEISTNADSEGNGGDITINTNTLTALENSDITANAIEGRGGNIRIRTQGLFLSPDSEITAESERGVDGVVEINTLNADPNQGLVNLPEEVVDVTGLVARGCPADLDIAGRGGSKFTVTGRGGLPPTPQEALNSDAVLEDWGKIAPTSNKPNRENQGDRTDSTPETPATPEPFVPATGWVISSNGEVTLTAQAPTITPQNPSPTPASCNGT